MLPNPVKGEVEVGVAGATYVLCYSWPAQKAVGRKFGKRFRDVMLELEDLDDEALSFLFWSGFQHHHSGEVSEADADGFISELGFTRAMELVSESLKLAYDIPADDKEAGATAAQDPPPATGGTRSTRTRASDSGSSSV